MTIAPGEWLGVLGGGQLGRMFCMQAQTLGYRVCVLDPSEDSPAGAVADRHLRAGYLDADGLEQLATLCRGVTTEFENVPARSLELLAGRCLVSPDAASVSVAQDRIEEKRFIAAGGADVAPHRAIVDPADLEAIEPGLLPGILKTARLGYDGKGQVAVDSVEEARAAWDRLHRVPCVLERRLALERELSVVVCRGRDGACETFPVVENVHRDGILAVSVAPARVSPALAQQARETAIRVAGALRYVGVLCVEMFELTTGGLLVNEIAPRPHNSGHFTIDACVANQFEQQARVLAGLPLGDPTQLAPAVMLNLLGDLWFGAGGEPRPPRFAEVAGVRRACLHLYGKQQARRGRKMGHVTVLGDSLDDALARAGRVAEILGLERPR
ncbi:MAG TPA: 5-(carboxyamino)imidazole ribonucleotide synthase [Burkholderiaceae bacterium]